MLVVVLLLLLGAGLPARACAHGPVNPAASSYLARVRSAPHGIRVRVVDGDLRLWMSVAAGLEVTVLDYQGAPYVRFTSSGVDVNRNSAMYYLNQSPPEIPPTSLGARTRPHWFRATSHHSFEWHDGRLHALAITLASSGARRLGTWTIPLRINGRPARVTGVLDHAPGPSAGWWWPIILVLVGLPALLRLGDRELSRRLARWQSWAALPAFVALSVAAGLHGRPGLARSRLLELGVELLFGAWAAWNLWRGRRETLLCFLIGFAAFYRGLAAIVVLWRGDVLLALPAAVSRGAVVVCLATGCGLMLTIWALHSTGPAGRERSTRPPEVPAAAERAPLG